MDLWSNWIPYILGTIAVGYVILFLIKYLHEKNTTKTSTRSNALAIKPAEILPTEVKFIQKIAKGSYGEVWEGECRGTRVAIKKLFRKNYGPKQLDEFRREVEANTQKQHKNICLFMGAHTKDPLNMFLVVELLEPKTVGHLLRERAQIPMLRRILMAKDCATGMSWLHGGDVQVLHRDLKPDNLLMDKDWNVKVGDFGLSCVKLKKEEQLEARGIGGTPLWIAPEIFRNEKPVPASDVYSFGLVLWEIITGDVLFADVDDFDELKRQITQEKRRPIIPKANIHSEEIHPWLGELMASCWQDDPYRRPDFLEIAKRLQQIFLQVALPVSKAREIWAQLATEDLTKLEVDMLAEKLGLESDPVAVECIARIAGHEDHRPRSLTESLAPDARVYLLKIEDFAHLINWFGPLDPFFAHRIKAVMSCRFFHGPLDVQAAEETLSSCPKGTYLIRASKTRPDAPFSLSIRHAEKISHIRINKNSQNQFTVKIQNETLTSEANELLNFIQKISPVFKATSPLETGPYASIFSDKENPKGSYSYEDVE